MIIRCEWLTKRLARSSWVERCLFDREPDQIIGGEGSPYLYRWRLLKGRRKWGNVYLHLILRDDDDRALHDHPWPSVSFVLSGPLSEVRLVDGVETVRCFNVGDIVFRSPSATHRLFLSSVPALTLFVVGPRVREWGFHCPKGWRHWRAFTSGAEGEVIGKACDD